MSRALSCFLAAAVVGGAALAQTARATLIWNGSAANGLSVFKNLNIEDSGGTYVGNPSPNGSSVTVVTDPTYGQIWKFDKAVNDKRCEAHGASGFTPVIGGSYYIGWRSKVTYTGTVNAFFQWKSYGSPMVQNFPLVLKTVSGPLQLHYYPPNSGDDVIWSHSISTNTWYTHVLHIYVSDQTSAGYVEYWYNGTMQTLNGSSTRFYGKTFDGSSVDPKWGVYGATSTHVTNYVAHLRIGTTYADAAP